MSFLMFSSRVSVSNGATGRAQLTKGSFRAFLASRRLQSGLTNDTTGTLSHNGLPTGVRLRRTGTRRRFPKYLTQSPTQTLAVRLNGRNQPLTYRTWTMFRALAQSRSVRLPVVTAQVLMRREEMLLPTSLSECFDDDISWRTRLNHLAYKGITQDLIEHWLWIMTATTHSERVARFLSSERHRPIFVLFSLLRQEETFQDAQSLISLIEYIGQNYVAGDTLEKALRLPYGAVRRTFDGRLNMTPGHFTTLLRRLGEQCLKVWPAAITSVAQLACKYIESLPKTRSRRKLVYFVEKRRQYVAQCRIFNTALQLFAKSASLAPLENMKYNWQAQRMLLACSNRLERPLIISGQSYTAIQSVLIGLKKTPEEVKVASRSRKTWPPYREEWDGLDERRNPKDDLSRSVKVGLLKRESGYPEDTYDRALGALGGALTDQSPTIQTRSARPKLWTDRHASHNAYSAWAAQVRATRNAQEAWKLFQAPPTPDLVPNFQVYAEMFEKIVAEETSHPSSSAPGDGREIFPAYQANLSDFEKARVKPPDVDGLYDVMRKQRLQPFGKCLVILVSNAPSVAKALEYLHASPHKRDVDVLATDLEILPTGLDSLRRIPLPVFNAYVSLLCRLSSTAVGGNHGRVRKTYLDRAISLVTARLQPEFPEAKTYKAPWYHILKALSGPKNMTSFSGPLRGGIDTLSAFMSVFERVNRLAGLDIVMFECLALAVTKATLRLYKSLQPLSASDHSHGEALTTTSELAQEGKDLCDQSCMAMIAAFSHITRPVPAYSGSNLPLPQLYHDITPTHIYRYMRALGACGEMDEMTRVVEWFMQAWSNGVFPEETVTPSSPQYAYAVRILIYSGGYLEYFGRGDSVRELRETLAQLREEGDCTLQWPEPTDTQHDVIKDTQVVQFLKLGKGSA